MILWPILYNWRDWLLLFVTFLSLLSASLLYLWFRVGRKLEAEVRAFQRERRLVLQVARELRSQMRLMHAGQRTRQTAVHGMQLR